MECQCRNCKFIIKEYNTPNIHLNNNIRKYKSGVIIHNTLSNKVLIVQSRGNMWGFPKGSFELGENFKTCAIRELKEETGISIKIDELTNQYRLNNFVSYYYVNIDFELDDIQLQNGEYNDANGISWIKLDCLKDLMLREKLKLNYHARNCLYHFFKISRHNL
jgi:8-oxo-dGTP pyrophosphatase MutT (NUDIX family)